MKTIFLILVLLLASGVCLPQVKIGGGVKVGGGVKISASSGGSSSLNQGINFRSTSGYVTDGTNQTYCLAADFYPTTRSGQTFGWNVGVGAPSGCVDRDNTNPVQLAGICYRLNGGTQAEFRWDIANGTYNLRIALGDTLAQDYQFVEVRDDSTVLWNITDTNGTAANHYLDANGTDFTNTTWVGSNIVKSITITTGILRIRVGPTSAQGAGNATTLAAVYID